MSRDHPLKRNSDGLAKSVNGKKIRRGRPGEPLREGRR